MVSRLGGNTQEAAAESRVQNQGGVLQWGVAERSWVFKEKRTLLGPFRELLGELPLSAPLGKPALAIAASIVFW